MQRDSKPKTLNPNPSITQRGIKPTEMDDLSKLSIIGRISKGDTKPTLSSMAWKTPINTIVASSLGH